jgi:1-phosphatidylinositol phosphodiesterase
MIILVYVFQLFLAAGALADTAHGKGHTPSLGNLALQKLLDDASQIFGQYDLGKPSSQNPATEWMKRYPDSTPLVRLNIPGGHDIATWNFSSTTKASIPADAGAADPAFYRTQSLGPVDALNAGLRFFDLRYALDPSGTFLCFWHHNALLSDIAHVDDVMFAFYAWLHAHPSEVVILSFQYEGGTVPGASNNAAVQTQLFNILTSPAAKQYISQTKDELRTLGQERGKIILFRRFDLDKLPAGYDANAVPGIHLSPGLWTDDQPDFGLVYNSAKNLTAYIEDYYEPDDVPIGSSPTVDIEHKLNATKAHLQKASTQYLDSLFITFSSGEHNDNVPPVYPEIMALGNGTQVTPLGGVNQQLVPFLKGMSGKRMGIVVLDYWDQPSDLVRSILGL